jgi:hypothetical protein
MTRGVILLIFQCKYSYTQLLWSVGGSLATPAQSQRNAVLYFIRFIFSPRLSNSVDGDPFHQSIQQILLAAETHLLPLMVLDCFSLLKPDFA